MHPELPYIAFIAAALVLVPLPWHWRAGNVATISIIAWLFVTNIIYGVDAIIWSDNVDSVAVIYCDICLSFTSSAAAVANATLQPQRFSSVEVSHLLLRTCVSAFTLNKSHLYVRL